MAIGLYWHSLIIISNELLPNKIMHILCKLGWSICSGFGWSISSDLGGQHRANWGRRFVVRYHPEYQQRLQVGQHPPEYNPDFTNRLGQLTTAYTNNYFVIGCMVWPALATIINYLSKHWHTIRKKYYIYELIQKFSPLFLILNPLFRSNHYSVFGKRH